MTDDEIDPGAECEHFRVAYEAGDRRALWHALVFCAVHDIRMWHWLASEIIAIQRAAEAGKIPTWNHVFGDKPCGEGQRRGAATFARRFEVYNRIQAAKDAGRAIDDQLFEDIGRELGVGGRSTVADLYGWVNRVIQRLYSKIGA